MDFWGILYWALIFREHYFTGAFITYCIAHFIPSSFIYLHNPVVTLYGLIFNNLYVSDWNWESFEEGEGGGAMNMSPFFKNLFSYSNLSIF